MKIKYLLVSIFLLFLFSCTSSSTFISSDCVVKSPSVFSFLDIDPNNTDQKYINKMKKYNEIIKIVPIPIFIINQSEFIVEFMMDYLMLKKSGCIIMGMYVYDNGVPCWPSEFIFVNNSLTPEQTIATFFHETGHYKCKIIKCNCFSGRDRSLREQHAFINELNESWRNEDYKVLESSIRTMANLVITGKNLTYKKAVFDLMQKDIWRKSMEKLKKLEKEKNR